MYKVEIPYIRLTCFLLHKMVYRTYQISSDTFWGWQMTIDDYDYNIEEVIKMVKDDLIDYLKRGNLLNLVEKVNAMKLHCHCDIPDRNNIIYLCDHCIDD